MLQIGKFNRLKVARIDKDGAWLQAGEESLLLRRRELPEDLRDGDLVEVFVYRLGEEVHATMHRPFAQAGEFAWLRVREISSHGAYLEWGMEKELLVPFREQPEPLQVGRSYLIRVRLDRQERMVGSARIDKFLETEATGLKPGDPVQLILWQFTSLGAKMIVNHRFAGVLYREELRPKMAPGDSLTGFVRTVREDGRLDLTLRKVGVAGVEAAKAAILAALEGGGGYLPLHDQSSPEAVQQALGLSKKLFKKALGGLYKQGQVKLEESGVRAVAQDSRPERRPVGKPGDTRSASPQRNSKRVTATKKPAEPARDKRTRRRNKRNGPRSGSNS